MINHRQTLSANPHTAANAPLTRVNSLVTLLRSQVRYKSRRPHQQTQHVCAVSFSFAKRKATIVACWCAVLCARFLQMLRACLSLRLRSSAPTNNNTNPDGKSEFVLFFTREYFGVKFFI